MISFIDRGSDHDELLERARKLPAIGKLKIQDDGRYFYLKVDHRFIDSLLPLVKVPKVKRPNYFHRPNACGAHVSLVYPDERVIPRGFKEGGEYGFYVDGFFVSSFENKFYYALRLSAPQLEELRLSLGMEPQPRYKSFTVPFHITIGVG